MIVREAGTIHYGKCQALFVPSLDGEIVVLPYHTPMIAKLGKGEVSIRDGRIKNIITNIETGLIYVGDNEVTVLVDL